MVELLPVPVEPTQTTQLPSLSGEVEDSDFRKLLRDKLRENFVLEGLLSDSPIVKGRKDHQITISLLSAGRTGGDIGRVRSFINWLLLVIQNYSYLMTN